MQQLIETSQEYELVCDNPECDYKLLNETPTSTVEDSERYINMPCPQCGENLLTLEDYLTHKKLMAVVRWLNRWFSWLTLFSFKKGKRETLSVHTHKGIKIEKET